MLAFLTSPPAPLLAPLLAAWPAAAALARGHTAATPTGADVLRAAVVLALAAGQVVMAYWPAWRRWPETITTRSAALRTPAVPVGWAFAIWGPIFLACLAFGVYQALPAQWADPLLRRVGWLAAAAFGVNVAWEWVVPRRGLGWASVALIVGELALQLWLLAVVLGAGPLTAAQTWSVAAPWLLYAGWTSAAAFVNLSSTLRGARVRPMGLGAVGGASLLVGAAAALGTGVAWRAGSWVYAAAVAWALVGVVVANRSASGEGSPVGAAPVAWVAAGGALLVLGAALLSPAFPWLAA